MADSNTILDLSALRQKVENPRRIESEFEVTSTYKAEKSDLPPNVERKNRYVDVLPTPSTRVPLKRIGDDATTEFINANYVDGYLHPKRYIAAQGPIQNTIVDFWRMIWEQEVSIIAMMTGLMERGRNKCERYWPEVEKQLEFGPFKLTNQDSVDCGHYVLTTIEVQFNGETRKVIHFWYTNWPDHGVPEGTWEVLDFVLAVRQQATTSKGPIIVHCSAGIGRTGTFMAIDFCINELNAQWRVTDVHKCLVDMRRQRGGSIQTPIQYIFVHRALLDYLTPGFKVSIFGDNEPRDIGLIRGTEPSFGFSIRGSQPPFIIAIKPGSHAERNGLVIGDHILAVNQKDVTQMQHKKVVEMIRSSGKVVTLTVLSKSPATGIIPQEAQQLP